MDAELDRTEFLRLILEGDRSEASRLAVRLFEEQGATYLYEEVIQPALYEVGRRWQARRITVADEHLATAIAQASIAGLYAQFPWPTGGPRVIVGCAEGERHELGARMVADLLALHGWDEVFLGADVPIEYFASKVRETAPTMVAVSVTIELHLQSARAVVEAIRHAHPTARILVGGLATRALRAGDTLGADAVALSGSHALEVARQWGSDVTEVARAGELPRSEHERLREEWVAMVAHDLQGAVQTITLATEHLLRLRANDASDVERRTVERIRSAARRLSRMVADLSAASLIASKRLPVKARMVDVPSLVRTVIEDLRPQGRTPVLRLPSGDRAQVWADPDRLHQVLTNLLSNALKYGDAASEIAVEIVPHGDEMEMIVSNGGPGIPPEQLQHIFSRFKRARGASTSGRPGLGLGLYIARGLVEAQNGRLWAESVPGEKTSFHVTLPTHPELVLPPAEPAPRREAMAPRDQTASGETMCPAMALAATTSGLAR